MAPGRVAHDAGGRTNGDRRRPQSRYAADPSHALHGPARAARGAVATAGADRHADSHRDDRGADGGARRAQHADRANPEPREAAPAHAGGVSASDEPALDAAHHRQRPRSAALRADLARLVADRAAYRLHAAGPGEPEALGAA